MFQAVMRTAWYKGTDFPKGPAVSIFTVQMHDYGSNEALGFGKVRTLTWCDTPCAVQYPFALPRPKFLTPLLLPKRFLYFFSA